MKKGGNKTEKYISLNKILTMTVIIAYIVFLLLLFWMDSILVVNYRRERRNEERQQVGDYAETLDGHLGKIEELMYDIFAYNEDFRDLNGPLSELEEFDCVYEIDYIMKNRVMLYQWINGYMLSYHGNEKWRYSFESSAVDLDCADEMKKFVTEQIREGENWKRTLARFGGRDYCFIFCSKENVSLCGVYDLSRSVQSCAGALESSGEVLFTDGSRVYGMTDGEGEETAEDLAGADGLTGGLVERNGVTEEILAQVSGLNDSFDEKISGAEYFGKRVGGTELWLVYKKPVTIFTFMNVAHMLLFLLTFSTLIIAWFVYRYIRKDIILPLRKLVGTMNEVSGGNWDSVFAHDSALEEIRNPERGLTAGIFREISG